MAMQLDRKVLLVAVLFWFIAFVPFMIYCHIQLWRHRGKVYMKKRHIGLLLCTVDCIWLLTIRSVFFNQSACAIPSICNSISLQLDSIIDGFAVYPLVIGFTARSWFLFYDLKWNAIMLNVEWWHHINVTQTKDNWILNHKHSFGSLKRFMWKYLLSYAVFCIVTCIILSVYDLEYASMMSSIHMILSLIITHTILCKVPLSDAFQIQFELTCVMVMYTVLCLYFGITESQDASHKYLFFAYAKTWVNMMGCVSISYMTILYPIRHFTNKERNYAQLRQRMANTDFKQFVFSCADNFNCFMQHLVKEMAVENLCFLLEVFQLKQRYMNDSTVEVGLHVHMPPDLPLSSIVDGSSDLKQQTVLLYNKYIVDSAELQVNISWEDRKQIEQAIGVWTTDQISDTQDANTDCDELLLIYDDALKSVMALLHGSFVRFKNSELALERTISEITVETAPRNSNDNIIT